MGRGWQILIGSLVLIFNVGCASSRWVPTRSMPNERQGFFDRLGKMEPTHQSDSYQPEQRVAVQDIAEDPPIVRRPKKTKKLLAKETRLPRTGNPSQLPAARVVKDSKFQWPLRSVEITSNYGKRGRYFHDGIDLRAKSGTPVYASQAGIVLYAESRIGGYGNMIVLRHPDKMNTIYAHNSKVLVKRGQKVEQGQQIAVSGNTGRSSGPHVHFEIRKGVSAMNPMKFLPRIGVADPAERKLGKNGLGRMTASNEK